MDYAQRIGGDVATTIAIYYLIGQHIFVSLCLIAVTKYILWHALLLLEVSAQAYEVFVPIHQILNDTLYEVLNFPILLVLYKPGTGFPDNSDDDYPVQDDSPQEAGDPFHDEL